MENLLYIRQRIKTWCAAHETYWMPAVKFLLMMTILLVLNWHLGYRYMLMRWVVVILASLVGCLLPWSGMSVVVLLYLLGHVSALSWEGTAVLTALLFVAMLLHYLFLPGGSFLIILVCLAFYLRVPYLAPLLIGAFGSVLSFIPVGIGVVLYYALLCLEEEASFLLNPANGIPDCFIRIIDGLRSNQEMMLTLVVFCLTVLAVYALSHLSMDYACFIAVAAGSILILLLFLLGGFLLDIPVSYVGVLIGCLICCALSMAVSFWANVVDYARPEHLQFEDDEYVYYVKAFPKLAVTRPEPEVKEINSRREEREEASPEEEKSP